MLFVPDEDYIRLPDQTSNVNVTITAVAADAVDDKGDDDDEDQDVFDEDAVPPSILFASQAQYLGHSNQVSARRLLDGVYCMYVMYAGKYRFRSRETVVKETFYLLFTFCEASQQI